MSSRFPERLSPGLSEGQTPKNLKHSSVEGFSNALVELRHRLDAISDRVYAVSAHLIGHPPPTPATQELRELPNDSQDEPCMAAVISDLTATVNKLDATVDRLY